MKLATVIRSFAKCALAAVLAVACTSEAVIKEQAPEKAEPVALPDVPGMAVVEFDEDLMALIEEELSAGKTVTKSEALNVTLQELGISRLERVFPYAGEYEARTRKEGLHRFYQVEFSTETPVTKAVTGLSDVPGIASVEPVRKVQRRGFNDPYLDRQWNMQNKSYSGADINVMQVWDQYTSGSSKVIVSVVDEGIFYKHPDLAANMWDDGTGSCGFNFVRNNYLIVSDEGHGTHVAGVIGAVSNNGIGVAGIAGGNSAFGIPGVRLMSCQIFDTVESSADLISERAIKWGADHGAVISNNSWGYGADGCLGDEPDGVISAEELRTYKSWKIPSATKAAIDYFIKYAGCDEKGNQLPDSPMKGGVIIFAAGNEDIDYDVICDYDAVIAVGATGLNGNKASYSNYGDWVDVAAPGGNGTSASNSILSTVPTDVYSSGYEGAGWAGTSMASPHVAGVAALLVSYFGGPDFTQETCRKILLESLTEEVGGNKPIGKRLDAGAAFEYGIALIGPVNPDHPQPPVITLSQEEVTVHAHESAFLTVKVEDPNQDVVSVTCLPGSDALEFLPSEGRVKITGQNAPAGTYQAVFTATDATGLSAEAVLPYTILPNHAPVAVRSLPNMILRESGGQYPVDISGLFQDEDGETPGISISTEGNLKVNNLNNQTLLLTPGGYGLGAVSITAADALGKTAQVRFQVAVKPDTPVDVFPTPTTGLVFFWIDSEEPTALHITLYSAQGSKVLSGDYTADIFSQVPVDLSALAPGQYTAILEYDGAEYKMPVVKI